MDECRKQFETLMSLPPYEMNLERQGDNGAWPGNYRSYPVQLAWCAWEELWNRRAEMQVPDCSKCANRGKLDGLSQEFYCDSCKYSKTWLDDNFAAAPEGKQ